MLWRDCLEQLCYILTLTFYFTAWRNMKIAKELEERERFDDMQFQRAGRGPIIKTYKFDPTKVSGPPVTPPTKK